MLRALPLEVAFNADEKVYLDYMQDVFNITLHFAAWNILLAGYISLRYYGGSGAMCPVLMAASS